MWKTIKGFLKSFADVFSLETPPDIDSSAFKRIATSHGINRRKNARINYPEHGACGPFPSVFHKNQELKIANISVGGLLVQDDTGVLGTNVGETIILDLYWPELKLQLRARIVGAVLKRRHIQFTDFNAQAFVRISDLIKPGYIGQRFYKIDNPSGQLEALEMWVGPTNETLVFLDNQILAEYNAELGKILFPANEPPFLAGSERRLTLKEVQDHFVLFTNFNSPSVRVKKLIDSLERWFRVQNEKKRTGTDG